MFNYPATTIKAEIFSITKQWKQTIINNQDKILLSRKKSQHEDCRVAQSFVQYGIGAELIEGKTRMAFCKFQGTVAVKIFSFLW